MSSQSAPEQQRSSRSASRSQSQTTSHSSTPGPQSSQVHGECLKDINTQLAMLAIDATPRRVADLCKDVLKATHRDAARDMSTATLVNIVKLQSQVIERQHAQHILDDQLHGHLKTQLANKGQSREQTGGVLKHGYGALDSHALDALEEEAAMKRAEAADKEQQREEASEERQHKRNEAAAVRVIRAAETEQRKIARAAEQERKAAAKAAKVAEKAARAAVIAARRGRGCGAGAVRGRGQGCGRGQRGRAGAQGGGPAPFPMNLESDLDGSGLEGNISLTRIPSSTHSEHSTPSNGSGRSDDNKHSSQGGPAGAGHQV